MPHYVVYESSKKNTDKGGKKRSAPIAADDVKSRQALEAAGWKVVEEFDADEATAQAFARSAQKPLGQNLPRVTHELNALQTGGFATIAVEDEADGDAQATEDEPRSVDVWAAAGITDAQRQALEAAGYGTEDALKEASDDALRDVSGIGAATVRNLRKALSQPVG